MSSSTTKNFDFKADAQKRNPARLSRFIEICVQHSENADWMQPMLDSCLCILCENDATAPLVAKTMVDFYVRVVIKRYDEKCRTPFWHALRRIRERIYQFIVNLSDDSVAVDEILNKFFERFDANPEIISYDNQGMGEIIGKFFVVPTLDVNLKLLSALHAFHIKHPREHGENLLQMCANQPAVINGLDLIICGEGSVRAQRLALQLAADMQGLNFYLLFIRSFIFLD